MSLIVTDAAGRKYRSTGQFREPKPGEFVYCFTHKHVEQRMDANGGIELDRMHTWCSSAHVEFLLHRIIVEPVAEPEYEVTLRLTADQFRQHSQICPRNDYQAAHTVTAKQICDAIRAHNYREVTQ